MTAGDSKPCAPPGASPRPSAPTPRSVRRLDPLDEYPLVPFLLTPDGHPFRSVAKTFQVRVWRDVCAAWSALPAAHRATVTALVGDGRDLDALFV